MKKISLLAVALTPFIGASVLSAQTSGVVSDPVGYITVDIAPGGLSSIGVSMTNPASAGGIIESVSGNTVSVNTDLANIDLSAPHYVEITVDPADGAPLRGDRFDIESISGSDITLDVGAGSHSTIGSVPAELAGTNFLIRRHVTLGQLDEWVSENSITGSPIPTLADQLLLFRDGGYVTYSYNGTNWMFSGSNADSTVVRPGDGAFFRRRGSEPLALTVLGEVRTNEFRQPLAQGLTFAGTGYPKDVTPAERGFDEAHGFTASPIPTMADQLLVWDGSGFVTYSLSSGSNWVGPGGVQLQNFDAAEAVFVRSRNGNEDFASPTPF